MGKTLRSASLAILLLFVGLNVQAQLYWNTNGSSSTLTATNWGTSAGGPFTTAWTNSSNIVFTANSAITNVANTPVGNLSITAGTVTWTAAGTFTTNGNIRTFDIATASTLTWNGQSVSTTSGTGFIKNGGGTWNIGAQGNAYTGGFTLNAGTIVVGGTNALGTGPLTINGGVIVPNSGTARTIPASSITIGGDFQLGDATNFSAGTGNLNFSNNVSLGSATRTVTIGGTGTYTFGGVISGTGSAGVTIQSSSSGIIQYANTGTNTYPGATTINGGTLRLSNTGAKIPNGSALVVASGATFDFNGYDETVGSLAGAGSVHNSAVGGVTFGFGGDNTNTVFSGTITGSGNVGIQKTGTGTFTLSGSKNAGGPFGVYDGTLNLTGSVGVGQVSVYSSGTLSGTGSTAGTVTVDGTISPAGSVTTGNITLNDMVFNPAAVYKFDISNVSGTAGNASGWDKITVPTTLTVSSTSGSPATIYLIAPSSGTGFNDANSYSWVIASAGSVSGFAANKFTINTSGFGPSFTGTFAITQSGNDLVLTYTPGGSAPSITSSLTSTATYGTAYSYFITATNSPTSYGASGLPAGLSVNTSTGEISGTPTTIAGSPFSVTITATNASGSDNKTLNLTVNPKALTISGISISNKTYNATTAATISGTPSLVGIYGSDVVTLGGSPTATFNTSAVGTAKPVTVSGYTISGANAGSYTLTQPSGLTANVTAKALTVSGATADNKVYNGNTTATISGATLVGVETADNGNVTVSGGGTFASANVGTGIAVTASLSLSGSAAGNYTLTQPTGLTANITQASQTITFGALADKTLGDAPFALTATASSGLTVSYTSSNTSVATVSGSTVTIVGVGSTTITASQAGNSNYSAASNVQQTQLVLAGPLWTNPITATDPSTSNPFTTGDVVTSNITVSGISRGTGITGATASNRYSANNWSTTTLDANDYFEFTLTPSVGYEIDFTSFVYTAQTSSGTPTVVFRSSVDGFASNIGTASAMGATILLSGAAYQDVTSAITFRYYVYGIAASGTTHSINDFTFNGSVNTSSIPTVTISNTGAPAAGNILFNTTDRLISGFQLSPSASVDFTAVSIATSGTATTSDLSNFRLIYDADNSGTYNVGDAVVATVASLANPLAFSGFTQTFSSARRYLLVADVSAAATDGRTITASISASTNVTTTGAETGTATGNAQTIQAPEINVKQSSTTIASGGSYNFGNIETLTPSSAVTFTIENSGAATLSLSGSPIVAKSGTNAADFTINQVSTSSSVAASGTTTFTITFTPGAAGSRTATISIANNDGNGSESPYTFTVSGTGTNSQASDIEMDASYSYNSNIPYNSFQGTTLTNTIQCEGMFRFRVRDGGSSFTDNDTYGTTLTAITFSSVANIGAIRSAAIFDGNTMIANAPTISTGSGTIAFSGLTLAASDGAASNWYTLRVSFNNTSSTITDNAQLSFTIIQANVTANSSGSGFTSFSVTSSTTSDRNRIEVTADRLTFGQQPTNTGVSTNMSPSVTVRATDANSITDADVTGTVSVTSTGTMDTSPKTASLSSGVATFNTIYHTATGTGFTLSATKSGLTSATSSTFDITTIVYVNGDYRTTGSGTWVSNNASPAIWERYNGSTWATSNSPTYNTTNSVYIQNGHTITSGGSFGSSVNMKIMSGGQLTVGHSSTAGNMYIYDGGTLQINASFTMASAGTFEVEDNADVIINYAYGTPSSSIWQGTEIFHANSNLTLTDWDGANDVLIPDNTSISTNTYNGYTAVFGNVIIDFASNIGASDDMIFLESGTTINLAHGDLTFRTNDVSGADMRLATTGTVTSGIGGDFNVEDTYQGAAVISMKTSGTLTFTIKGNMQLDAATVRLMAGSSSGASSTVNVEGDLNITPSAVLDFNSTVAAGVNSTLSLKGDLTVATSGLLRNSNTSVNGTLNFNGAGDGLTAATTQTIDIASTGATENRYINFYVKSGAYVQLINRNFELGTGSGVTVENGGTLDFNFTGTTPLNIVQVSGATTNTFVSDEGSTLKITSTNGLVKNTANSGNVQMPTSSKTFNQTAYFYYIGKANQVTGDALTSTGTGKIVYVNLMDNTLTLTLTNDIGISNGPTLDALGGRLEILKGIVIGTAAADFRGSGRLVMSDGTYRISGPGSQSPAYYLPNLVYYSQYDLTGGTVELNGVNIDQTLSGGPTYYNLKMSGTNTLGSNEKNISENVTINNNLEVTENAVFDTEGYDVNGDAGLTMDAGMWRMSRFTATPSTVPSITGIATDYNITGGIIEFYGTGSGDQQIMRGTFGTPTQTVTYYNLEINATTANETAGNVNAQASFNLAGTMNVNSPAIFRLDEDDIVSGIGDFTIQSNAGLFYGNDYGIKTGTSATSTGGNVRVTGTRTYNTGTYGFVSPGAMVTGTGLPATVNKLFLLKNATSDLVTLTNSVSVSQTLGFTKGVITTGTKKVTVLNGGTVTGASSTTGWVNGNLEKYIATGTNVTQTYQVGDASYYAFAALTFASVSDADSVIVLTASGDHPNIGSSTINVSSSVNRYWDITNGGVVFTNYSAVFNFNNPADLDGTAVGNHSSFIGGNYAGATWSYPTVGTKTTTSTQLTGLSSFGGFQLGMLQTGVYVWTGASGVNANWTTATNWSGNTVPPNDCGSNVNIPTVSVYPTVNTNALIGNLYVSGGATVTVSSDSLSVCGSLTGGSATTASFAGTGKLVLKGSSQQAISGKLSFETLRLYNTSGAQMQSGASADIYKVLELPRGTFDVNGNTLKFKSQSTSDYGYLNNFSSGFTGSISGSVTAELTITNNNYQHFIGSPVSATLSQFGANGTAGYVQPTYTGGLCNEDRSVNGTPYGKVFSWEEDKAPSAPGGPCPIYGWKVENNGATAAASAKGYSVYLRSGTLSVTGAPNQNSTYTISNLANTGYSLSTVQHPTAGAFESGWQLLSNPYLAPYDMLNSLIANGSNFNDLMVWIPSGPFSGTYQSLVAGSFNGNQLAPFQGVMVHRGNVSNFATAQGAATFQFSKSYLTTPSTLPQFVRQASREALNITVSGNGFMDVTYVEFNDAATRGFDVGYDSRKMMSAVGQPTIYTILDSGKASANINYSVNEVSTIPLHVSAGADGTFTFTIEGINSFDATSYVYLEDKVTGAYLNVRDSNTYAFAMNEFDNPDRFVLHFTPPLETATENAACYTQGTITLTQPGSANWNYALSDGGSIVSTGVLNESSPANISVDAGMYTLTLTDNNGYTVIRDIEVFGVQEVTAEITASTLTAETGENIIFENTGINGADVVWDFGDGSIIGGVSNTAYAYSEPGVYTVTLTVVNADGCVAVVTQQITVTESTVSGVNNLNAGQEIAMWSSGNKVYVDFSTVKNTRATIDIYNILGQQLSGDKLIRSTLYMRAFENLEAGYVIVRVKNDEAITTKKLFIESR